MNKYFTALLLFTFGVSLFAATLKDDAFYKLDNVPAEASAKLKVGRELSFDLEENPTTGYTWSAAYDSRLCTVNLEHKNRGGSNTGAPGKVEVEVRALTPQPFTVTLNYARSWETGKAPLKTMQCNFNQVSREAAANAKPAAPADGKLQKLRERRYPLARIADTYQLTLRKGQDADFDFQESPKEGKSWKVLSFDAALVRVEVEHELADDPGEFDEAEFEIKALAPGQSNVVLVYGNNEKTVTIQVTAK